MTHGAGDGPRHIQDIKKLDKSNPIHEKTNIKSEYFSPHYLSNATGSPDIDPRI